MVKLINKHIVIEQQIATSLFNNVNQVCWVYYATKKSILIASQHDELFKNLHKTSMGVLKYKNNKGDRSLSIEELLIDNDINDTDKELKFIADEKMKILTIIV